MIELEIYLLFKILYFLEYSNLKKIGITEPDTYVKNLFANQEIEYLSSSCFADYYIHQIGDDIENTINQEGYCDLSVLVNKQFINFFIFFLQF